MPFSIIALALIVTSSLSIVLLSEIEDGATDIGLTMDEIDEMAALSASARQKTEGLAWQALLTTCAGDTVNESAMVERFNHQLSALMASEFPIVRSGLTAEVNVSGVHLTFMRLALDPGDSPASIVGTYIPAYVGAEGNITIKVISKDGNLTRDYPLKGLGQVPWPLLKDRMDSFEREVNDGLGDLSSMVNYMLESLAAYRTLQGWGASVNGARGLEETLTERDLLNALDLGLVLLQMEVFRSASPCLGMRTDALDGQGCWDYVSAALSGGGRIDPADLFLGLYGYDELDWRRVFSQALYSAVDKIALRWMEHLHLIDLLEIVETVGEKIYFAVNDLIDDVLDVNMAERRFKEWLEEEFEASGVPEQLYRYLGSDGPEETIQVRTGTMLLLDEDWEEVPALIGGDVVLDIPKVDIMAWEGWGDFHEQYKKGTKEIISTIRSEIYAVAEQISMGLFLPSTILSLDPRDGKPFLEEIKASLSDALCNKERWLRPAIAAAEVSVTSMDPMAEAAKAELRENRDDILRRQEIIDTLVSSVAEQLLSTAMASIPDASLLWDENLRAIEGRIIEDGPWGVYAAMEGAFERRAEFLEEQFVRGLSAGSGDGRSSCLAEVIARTGDPTAGLGVVLTDDVNDLLSEISHGLSLRGNQVEVDIPATPGFALLGTDGRVYHESLQVQVSYPSMNGPGERLVVSIADPRHFQGGQGEPQTHDTDLVSMKTASFQSTWGISFDGEVDVTVLSGGEAGEVVPMELRRGIALGSEQTVTVLTAHALMGVDYVNINTLGDHLSNVIEGLLRPIREGLEDISSGLRAVYRLIQSTIDRLIDTGKEVLEILSAKLGALVEQLQDFLRKAISTIEDKLAEVLLDIIGERSFRLCFLGVEMVIDVRPRDMMYREVSIPASFSMAFRANGCRIDVTTRLIKGPEEMSLLANASLLGDGWSVHAVIDPFMDVFQHMVEVRGIMDDACVELVMPEVLCYREVTFALSDIPGVGALLANIPLPIPGLKGSVDAGISLMVLEGRTDDVVINEYELNPAGEDAGREWVELYNPTSQVVDLAGWSLETRHGVQGALPLSGVLLPGSRTVHHFPGQALDNMGEGFPYEEGIVLRDEHGRRVDSTPFSTDCWNDGRTWQRAKDGVDRWEFRDGTKGTSNGKDHLSRFDLDPLQQAFAAAVTESIYQLTSTGPSMEGLALTLETAILRFGERLSSEALEKEVVIGAYVEVAVTEASSTAKVGMRMEAVWRCGTLRDTLHDLVGSAGVVVASFGNPFRAYLDGLSGADGIWLGMSSFGAIGIPKMISAPGLDLEVRYQTTVSVNLGVLAMALGVRSPGWAVEAGAKVSGVPAAAVPALKVPMGTMADIWLCKATVQRCMV